MNAQGSNGGAREPLPVRPLPVAEERARRLAVEEGLAADEALRCSVARARRLCEDQAEPFRSLAFSAVLEHLLRGAPLAGGVAQGRQAVAPIGGPPATDIPVAEFLSQRRLDSHPDRVVAVAYYHFHRFDGQGVTTKDLADAYTRSRARRPQNYPDVIASCVRKGYLVDGVRRDGMKTWVITGTGEAHVEQDL